MLSGVINDRFDIDRLAGEGGMGAVYRAWDRSEGMVVALKVLHIHSRDQVARFTREARLLSELDHPGIVRFIGDGTLPTGAPYLVMEWLEGESLSERLRRELLSVGETLRMARGVAAALAVAHERGVVHRDLKPGNVFLVDQALERVKVVDFGIARTSDPQRALTATESMLGTPGYMAPEQVRSSRGASSSADVYSLGCVIFKCLTGRTPFVGETPMDLLLSAAVDEAPTLRSLRADVPAELEGLVVEMLASAPERRPPNGQEASRRLEALAAGWTASGRPSWRPPAPTDEPAAEARAAPPAATPASAEPARAASHPEPLLAPAPATVALPPQSQAPGLAAGPASATPFSHGPVSAASLSYPRSAPPPAAPARRNLGLWLVAAAVVLLSGAAIVGAGALFWLKPESLAAVPAGSAAPSASAAPAFCAADYCEPLQVRDPKRVEAVDDLLTTARAAARRLEPTARFSSMIAMGVVDGRLDLTQASGAQFSFTGARTGQSISVVINRRGLMAQRSPARAAPTAEPGCNVETVWRNAVKAGLDRQASINVSYSNESRAGVKRRVWIIHSPSGGGSYVLRGEDGKLTSKP